MFRFKNDGLKVWENGCSKFFGIQYQNLSRIIALIVMVITKLLFSLSLQRICAPVTRTGLVSLTPYVLEFCLGFILDHHVFYAVDGWYASLDILCFIIDVILYIAYGVCCWITTFVRAEELQASVWNYTYDLSPPYKAIADWIEKVLLKQPWFICSSAWKSLVTQRNLHVVCVWSCVVRMILGTFGWKQLSSKVVTPYLGYVK